MNMTRIPHRIGKSITNENNCEIKTTKSSFIVGQETVPKVLALLMDSQTPQLHFARRCALMGQIPDLSPSERECAMSTSPWFLALSLNLLLPLPPSPPS